MEIFWSICLQKWFKSSFSLQNQNIVNKQVMRISKQGYWDRIRKALRSRKNKTKQLETSVWYVKHLFFFLSGFLTIQWRKDKGKDKTMVVTLRRQDTWDKT